MSEFAIWRVDPFHSVQQPCHMGWFRMDYRIQEKIELTNIVHSPEEMLEVFLKEPKLFGPLVLVTIGHLELQTYKLARQIADYPCLFTYKGFNGHPAHLAVAPENTFIHKLFEIPLKGKKP
jgi:hypothetical protein